MKKTTVLLENIYFGEGPRWKDGQLWLSDIFDNSVLKVDVSSGSTNKICEVDGEPSGLGWLADGRLLVVSMKNKKVMRLEDDGSLVEHADLSGIADHDTNDMVVDKTGRAYVGNFGFNLQAFIKEHGREAALAPNASLPTAKLACISPDGNVSVAADDLVFPNGCVLTDEGSTLVVAETFGRRLTAFDVASDGRLSGKRIWADLGDVTPDGICLDAAGAIWVADSGSNRAVRVAEGGEVLARVETSQRCFAVALGGRDGRTLYCCTAPSSVASDLLHARQGKIEQIQVEVPAY
ncbi:SMP-30/gluconolactonase/LRE family protein [Neobacillus rhizophilus]|uniref:SMP-30/gluconolactonase/LRE family protein n=1 Tax=Neobacillus rhizophilus TaxID=2833579 RepID=A0A942UBK2_9BACI|nr:SMP-30/gluconolactonase/LRE family protein [Neobacillus rhizophilus]MBS4215164.1 SMP-30/gluconolactonase/LRE family protein [Neobacillus rhizophilus]